MTTYSSYAPSWQLPQALKQQIREYFTYSRSQKQLICSVCGQMIKQSGFDTTDLLVAHFMRQHPDYYTNLASNSNLYQFQDRSNGVDSEPFYHGYTDGPNLGSISYGNYEQSYNSNNYENYRAVNTSYTIPSMAVGTDIKDQQGYGWGNSTDLRQWDMPEYKQWIQFPQEQSQRMPQSFSQTNRHQSNLNTKMNYGSQASALSEKSDNYDSYNNYANYGVRSRSIINGNQNQNQRSIISHERPAKPSISSILTLNNPKYNIDLNISLMGKESRGQTSVLSEDPVKSKEDKEKSKSKKSQGSELKPNPNSISYHNVRNFISNLNNESGLYKLENYPKPPPSSLYHQLYISKQSKQIQTIKEFFKNIDLSLNKQSALSMIVSKLSVSHAEAAQLIETYWWGDRNIDEISMLLLKRGIEFRSSSSNYDTVVISEKSTLSDYLSYGDCVYVVSYQQLVSLNSYSDELHNAYIFLVADSRSQLTFVSLGLVKQNTCQNIVEMLEMFYGAMHGFVSNSIVLIDTAIDEESNTSLSSSFRAAVQMFGARHLRSWSINFLSTNTNTCLNLDAEMNYIETQQQLMHSFNQQIQIQVSNFARQLQTLSLQTDPTQKNTDITDHNIQLRIHSNPKFPWQSHKYHPKSSAAGEGNSYFFVGVINKLKQIESLNRKLYLIKKPGERRCFLFAEFVSAVWRVNRNLRKIGREALPDFRLDFRKYQDPAMYKLYKMLGPKIFGILQSNYAASLKLKLRHTSPTTIRIREQTDSNRVAVYTLGYQVTSQYWLCNCYKLQETGIPCRHLIAVVRKYRGHIGYYLHERWVLCRSDLEKLKRAQPKVVSQA